MYEHVLSVKNCYIGVLNLELKDFVKLDYYIRKIRIEH